MWWVRKCGIYFCSLAFFSGTLSYTQAFLNSGQVSQPHRDSVAVAREKYIERYWRVAAKAPSGNRWNLSRWTVNKGGTGVSVFEALGIKKGTVHFKPLQAALPAQVSQSQRSAGSGASGGGSGLPKGGAPAQNAKLGQEMAAQVGWTGAQWTALNNIAMAESGWSTTAANPSGAYGIPQSLPASKMASAGADWQTNPRTQIKWMLEYIRSTYGTPVRAWQFHLANGWY